MSGIVQECAFGCARKVPDAGGVAHTSQARLHLPNNPSFFPFCADVITVPPSRRVLRIVLKPVVIPNLSARALAAFAAIHVARAERGRITCEIDTDLFFGRCASAQQRGCDKHKVFIHVSPRLGGPSLPLRFIQDRIKPKKILPCRGGFPASTGKKNAR